LLNEQSLLKTQGFEIYPKELAMISGQFVQSCLLRQKSNWDTHVCRNLLVNQKFSGNIEGGRFGAKELNDD